MKDLVVSQHIANNGSTITDQWYRHTVRTSQSGLTVFLITRDATSYNTLNSFANALEHYPASGGYQSGQGEDYFGYLGWEGTTDGRDFTALYIRVVDPTGDNEYRTYRVTSCTDEATPI